MKTALFDQSSSEKSIAQAKKTSAAIKLEADELADANHFQENTKQAMLNILEDLEAARELISSEKAKAEAMFASIGEGLIAVDNDKKIMMVNKVAIEMFGWKTDELIGSIVTDLPLVDEAGNSVPLEKRPTTIAIATGQITKVDYFFQRKDSSTFPIAVTATPIKLNGETIGLIEVVRDITREKEIDRAKSEFVSLASHQLRTPLGIAKWYLEAIQSEGFLDKVPPTARDYFNEVYKSNERLLALVRDLLSVSRIDQGKVKDVPESVEVVSLVKSIQKDMTILAEKNNVTLELDLKKKDIPAINIDPLRVQEVIENLVTNAISYSLPKNKVKISIDAQNEHIILTVADTGIGISKNDQKKLFTKFFRSQQAVFKNTEGSGLGLYVVKSYVESWGGDISVTSAEGKGSTFSITLPFQTKAISKIN